MADKKISALTAASTPLAGTEALPIVQGGSTVKVSSDDLTVKNVRSNSSTGVLQVTGPAAASTRVMTVPNANFTAARTDAANSFTGDQTLATGNLVTSAAKGIDFSANTGAAGETSSLLNWYEEGTWTPVVTATSGSLSSVSATGTYTRIGRQVIVFYNILISTNGTGATAIQAAGLPYTIANNRPYGVGNETDAVGFNIISQGIVATNYAVILKFDGTYPGGSGYRLQGNFTYTV